MKCLDLFSGIGGFSLGFDRAGIETTMFCEIDPYARKVLAKHWPDVPIHDDVRSLHGTPGQFDIICGGFPCQDISLAGKGAGLSGERSGLWWEFHRIIGEVRPAWVVAENVPALRSRGLDQVLGSLAEIGYDAEWHCVPAGAVGAPHRRDRVWIVAYPNAAERGPFDQARRRMAGGVPLREGEEATVGFGAGGETLACPDRPGLEVVLTGLPGQLAAPLGTSQWPAEPNVGRVAYGVPSRVDRLRCLGNAVVPQIPELIGRAIVNVHTSL